MKLVKLTQVAEGFTDIKPVWISPIHIVTIEPVGDDPRALTNKTLVRTSIGTGFALETMEEIEVLLDAWQPQGDPDTGIPKRKHRRST
jgi:hypothetical protein